MFWVDCAYVFKMLFVKVMLSGVCRGGVDFGWMWVEVGFWFFYLEVVEVVDVCFFCFVGKL